MKYWLTAGLLVGFLGFVALNLLAYGHAAAMLTYSDGGPRTDSPEQLGFWSRIKVLVTGVNLPRPHSHRPASDLAPGCQVLGVPVPGGIRLATWYCDRGADRPLVILFHGYSGQKSTLLREAQAILGLGASVLAVDFRGSGGSSESYTTLGVDEAEDVASVLRYAEGHLTQAGVLLFGRSMGAVAILRAIHDQGIRPDGIILEALFDTLLNTVRNRFRSMGLPPSPGAELLVFWGGWQRGFDGFRHNPVDYAASVRCPSLVMHGGRDVRATIDEARRVYAGLPDPKAFVAFEESGHESHLGRYPKRWRAEVGRFIKAVGKGRWRRAAANPVNATWFSRSSGDRTLKGQIRFGDARCASSAAGNPTRPTRVTSSGG